MVLRLNYVVNDMLVENIGMINLTTDPISEAIQYRQYECDHFNVQTSDF